MKKKTVIVAGILITGVCVALVMVAAKPVLAFLSNPETVRAWAQSVGIWAKLAFVGMVVAQIFFAFLPGEPLEICAGLAFGAVEGTLLCMIGSVLGTAAVFLFTRRFGLRLAERFFPVEKIRSIRFLQDASRLNVLTFILFFIPGTPKDLMTYVLGVTRMPLATCLAITGIARIPSIITSTIGGDALGTGNFQFALIVFAATAVISGIGLLVYGKISRRKNVATKAIHRRKDTLLVT